MLPATTSKESPGSCQRVTISITRSRRLSGVQRHNPTESRCR
jgi:hypothetical protein